jgi:hypothetical protein
MEDGLATDRYWSEEAVRSVLDRTLSYWIAPDLAGLSPAEHRVVTELVAAGRIVQTLYEDQVHHQAIRAHRDLVALDRRLGSPAPTRDLLELYDVQQGPVSPTLDNELLPFLPVDGYAPGKNVYPWAIEREEIDGYLETRPEERVTILDSRTAVRRTRPAALRGDLRVMDRYPEIDVLHPGLRGRLERLAAAPARSALYAVPYSLAWAGPIRRICRHLWAAADAAEPESRDFADYLRQRARDLLTDDYEAGDAAWVRGSFGRLDAVIGSHETYDDDLFASKSFFGLAILVRDEAQDRAQHQAMRHLQAIEDSLPYDHPKRVRPDIPAEIVDAVASFGNARLIAAQILPNDADLARKYGRKITLRANETMNPEAAGRLSARWRAAMLPAFWDAYSPRGDFLQTFWHEIGHYLGPDTVADGRSVLDALEAEGGLIEELKSELVSQVATRFLFDRELVSEADHRASIASGLLGGLRPVRPLRSQVYETLWLMELNFFLERGLLVFEAGRLGIRYELHAEVVRDLLRQVLEIQSSGNRAAAADLIERYSTWDERNEAVARAVTAASKYRFLHPRYAILGDVAG